ncbi:allantoate deiminase [Paenibacillus sp. WST5]|uniref:Allantoate deiminase n=2 Tax=Paenibacillus sedimenti TaxID=2770274 RepID=A0A926KW93_9BACL|nr:allantoate deiminase [Paenibacillus sedimenti]
MLAQFTKRVPEVLEWLATFGADPEGGVTRLLYTDAWLQAQQALAAIMQELGLEPKYDAVGNLYGKLQGINPELKPVLTGSHIDTVKNGGKYDGAYGVIASMLALGYLKAAFGAPKRTLEVVSFCEEEGSRFPLTFWGSGHVTGVHQMEAAATIADREGITLLDAMQRAGFTGGQGDSASRNDLGAYIEIHIEQGSVLEYNGKQIGIVTAIVGQKRLTVRVLGKANHAGTTPMTMRRDALAGAAEMVALTEKLALEEGDPLVATVGKLEVKQGTSNVVPGEVEFTLDIRHTDESKLQTFCTNLLTKLEEIAMRRELDIQSVEHLSVSPVVMHSGISAEIESICQDQGFKGMKLPSGAGHDAQLFGAVCPTALIFVPSRGGLSHNPEELTSAEDLAAGFQTLVQLLYQYGYGGKADEIL